jgi:uncharacterized protein (TIRG00374 family)
VLALLAILAARAVEWRRVFEAMRTANAAWLLVAVIANAGILGFWTSFWRDLLPRDEHVSHGNMFRIASIASAVMNTVPFLAGHASSVVLLVRRGGVSQHGALSVLALDQLGEGVAKVIVFVAVAALTPIPSQMRAGVLTASAGVVTLFVVLVVLAHRSPAKPIDAAADDRLVRRVRAFVRRSANALDTLRSARRSATALGAVLAMKAVEAIGIIAVQRSFGVDIPIAGTLLVLAGVLLATMIPLAPGNLGTYEAGVFFAYQYLGVPTDTSLALALVQHACFMIPAVGVGYVLLVLEARRAMASE